MSNDYRDFYRGRRVLITGGIAGLATAAALGRRDTPSVVLERRDQALDAGLGGLGSIESTSVDAGHYVLSLEDGAVLGDALEAVRTAGFQLLSCRDERSEVEEAFLALTREEDA